MILFRHAAEIVSDNPASFFSILSNVFPKISSFPRFVLTLITLKIFRHAAEIISDNPAALQVCSFLAIQCPQTAQKD